MDYLDAVTSFLDYGRNIKQYSPATVYSYKNVLIHFGETEHITTISDLTLDSVESFLQKRLARGLSVNGNFNIVLTIRAFVRFLNRKGVDIFDYTLIDVPRRQMKPVNPMSIEQVQAILDNLHRERDRLMALVMFTSGIRVNELVHLKVEDIDGTAIRVMGKGNKPRLCYVHELVAQRLLIYLSMEQRSSGYVFLSNRDLPINPCSVRYALRRAANKAGIERHIYPHLFRHTFATEMLKNGMDVRTVQVLLGHDQIQTTMRYLQITDLWKSQQYQKYKPKITLTDPSAYARMKHRINHNG